MSSFIWLVKFGRISGNMKILHILWGTPYWHALPNILRESSKIVHKCLPPNVSVWALDYVSLFIHRPHELVHHRIFFRDWVWRY